LVALLQIKVLKTELCRSYNAFLTNPARSDNRSGGAA